MSSSGAAQTGGADIGSGRRRGGSAPGVRECSKVHRSGCARPRRFVAHHRVSAPVRLGLLGTNSLQVSLVRVTFTHQAALPLWYQGRHAIPRPALNQ